MESSAEKIVHTDSSTRFRRVMSASSMTKDYVYNRRNEEVGSLKELMIEVPAGKVAYAVLAVGGFLGIGERLFAIPWNALVVDEDRKCFVMDADKERLKNAPGFDKNNWPEMGDNTWGRAVDQYWHDPAVGLRDGREHERTPASYGSSSTDYEYRSLDK